MQAQNIVRVLTDKACQLGLIQCELSKLSGEARQCCRLGHLFVGVIEGFGRNGAEGAVGAH